MKSRTLLFLVCGAWACTTSPPMQSTDAGGSDGAPMSDTGPPLETVNVVVVDEDGALNAANVVIDDALGMRHTATTGSDGHASVDGVAWGSGRVSITVRAAGHALGTLAGFTRSDLGARADASGLITLRPESLPQLVAFSGTLANVMDPTNHYCDVLADVGGRLTVTGTTFSGTVQARTPFNIYAFESIFDGTSAYHWTYTPIAAVRVSHAALTTTGGSATIDLASGTLPLTTVTGSMPVPPDGNRAQGGTPNVIVTSDETDGLASYGFASAMDLAADGVTFDYTVSQLAVIDAITPITKHYFQTDAGIYTEIERDGTPGAAAISSSEWLLPPRVVTPASGVTQSLSAPIEVADVDPAAPVVVRVYGDVGLVWTLVLPPAGTTVTTPPIPDGVDTSGWTNLGATATACEPWPGHRSECRRFAGGDSAFLTL